MIIAAATGVLVIAVALTAFLLPRGPGEFKLHGAIALNGTGTFYSIGGDGKCAGANGYDDLTEGASVVISDSSGKTIAVGSVDGSAASGSVCMFGFDVAKVPSGEKFYGLEVSHRGVVQFTEAEVKAGPILSIGID